MKHPLSALDPDSNGAGAHQHRIDAADNDGPAGHLALLYESRDEQFGAVIPFVRAGLERGERCLYVVDDNDTVDVVEAMEDAGVDVAEARETGQLTFHSTDDTYITNGSFDPEETISYLEETVSKAVDEEGYDHVRFTGEMTWALGGGSVHDALAEYEAKVNELYSDFPMTGLCQYNRERFPPAALEDVLRTHPRIVYDEAVCRNAYYVPPAEFLEDEPTTSTIERRLQTVREQCEERSRSRQFEELVRGIIDSVSGASTRETIDRTACDRLTDVGTWQFAWIGETSATSDRVTPRATAGGAAAYVEESSVSATDDRTAEPAGRAAAARSLRVVDDLDSVPEDAAWRRAARQRGVESVAAVPLVYEGISYGVLSVYSDEAGAFDDRARDVLGDVGRAVAFACNAVERRRALVSDRATELDLRLPRDDPFVDFAARTDATVAIDGVVPEPDAADGDGRLRVFFSVDGTARQQVETAAAAAEPFSSLSFVSERGDAVTYDGVVDGPGLLGTLLDHAVVPKSVAANGAEGRMVVRLAPATDVASFVRMLQDRYPGTDLVARREVECESTTREDFRAELRDRLTERQWDALQMAYLSGYFEWPRERSGEEVGARLDVSQPTFNRHLRDSLRKLLTPIFDDERDLDR